MPREASFSMPAWKCRNKCLRRTQQVSSYKEKKIPPPKKKTHPAQKPLEIYTQTLANIWMRKFTLSIFPFSRVENVSRHRFYTTECGKMFRHVPPRHAPHTQHHTPPRHTAEWWSAPPGGFPSAPYGNALAWRSLKPREGNARAAFFLQHNVTCNNVSWGVGVWGRCWKRSGAPL